MCLTFQSGSLYTGSVLKIDEMNYFGGGLDRLRPYIRLFFLVLIALGAYLLADISNLYIASHIEASMPLTSVSPLNKRLKRDYPASQKQSYESIVRANLFDPTMGIYVAPPAPAPTPIPVVYQPIPQLPPPPPPVIVPKVPLNVQLVGTVVHPDSPSYAVIQDNRTRRQLIYRVGDYLLDDAKITQIERNRVIVEREDERIVLEISLAPVSTPTGRIVPSAAPGMPPMPPPQRRGKGVQQISEGHWVMDRSEIDYAVDNLPEIMTKARVVPNFVDGKSNGFRIFAIQEDSIYAKIGLQNGDILRRVNQVDVRDPQNFLQVFQQLKGESRITVDFVRNTEEKTFDYTIR